MFFSFLSFIFLVFSQATSSSPLLPSLNLSQHRQVVVNPQMNKTWDVPRFFLPRHIFHALPFFLDQVPAPRTKKTWAKDNERQIPLIGSHASSETQPRWLRLRTPWPSSSSAVSPPHIPSPPPEHANLPTSRAWIQQPSQTPRDLGKVLRRNVNNTY